LCFGEKEKFSDKCSFFTVIDDVKVFLRAMICSEVSIQFSKIAKGWRKVKGGCDEVFTSGQ